MIETDPQLGTFNITARLLKLVNDMPKDQQLILLKQLIGENVTKHLFKLIVEMSEDQQIILLEQMGEVPAVESPITTVSLEETETSMRENPRKPCLINANYLIQEITTVSLEETETSMRENPRKPCLINANYMIQDQNFKSYILDISIGGVFIETNEKFPIGKKITLKFSLPNHPQPFSFSGKIAWSSPRGFGLKFDDVSPQQSDMLKTFVAQKE
jgi:Tfp pilus assembly protein PilZ